MSNKEKFSLLSSDPDISLDQLLSSIEKSLGITMTIHDQRGIFRGSSLSQKWTQHRHPICTFKRTGSYDQKCLNTCLSNAGLQAQSSQHPFEKHCWKGLAEVVVPIHREGQLQFIIFAGAFRSRESSSAELKPIKQDYQELPLLKKGQMVDLSVTLQQLGQSICNKLEEHAFPQKKDGDRRADIGRFIYKHATERVTLKDLAEHLYLSTSRTSHLVSDLFSKSFSDLLKEERIKRACSILKNSRKPIKQISHLVGLRNEVYFYRLFKREMGTTPKKYRDLSIQSSPTPQSTP